MRPQRRHGLAAVWERLKLADALDVLPVAVVNNDGDDEDALFAVSSQHLWHFNILAERRLDKFGAHEEERHLGLLHRAVEFFAPEIARLNHVVLP